MKKEGVLLSVVLIVLLMSLPILAQEDNIDRAYDCLDEKVKDGCNAFSVEDQSFIVLATGKCSSELKNKGNDDICWPDGGCRLRDTALAVLAYDRIGKNTEDAEEWLLNQKEIPKDLTWYLEIESDEETNCDISYGSTKKTITIGEDKKINRAAGSCLSLARDNYWLKIDDDCYELNFTISCDKSFLTTLLYEKTDGSTIYVSNEIESASAEGTTKHRVNSFCFKQGTSCDYEGSLWAALALAKKGEEVSSFLPYLIAMEEDNEEFFPSTFLYTITDYEEYYTKITLEQKDDYWKIKDSPHSSFYDTALALFALYGTSAQEINNAKEYLFRVQGDDGCWGDDAGDTAFLLYALEPRSFSTGGDIEECEDYGLFCTARSECPEDEIADENYICYGGKVCCETEPQEESCTDKGGEECEPDEECSGAIVPSSDIDKCCKGTCKPKDEKTECEKEGYNCRSSCADNEKERPESCDGGDKCCEFEPSSPSYLWVWVLVILIILVVLGIVFRKRLRMLISKLKNRPRRGPSGQPGPRPGFPPRRPGPRPGPRMMVPRRPTRPISRPAPRPSPDKELEDTLKKLKDMSK